jgi:nucleotide-binding universal stress UspA family protein
MVVPFDGSGPAVRAVDFVVDKLAKLIGSRLEVHLVNVQDGGAGIAGLAGRDAAEIAERLSKSSLEQGRRVLAAPLEKLEKAGVVVKSTVRIGDAASEIADYARDLRADGVVMGTRGLGAVSGLVLGSVASKVVHLVKVPVTLVK